MCITYFHAHTDKGPHPRCLSNSVVTWTESGFWGWFDQRPNSTPQGIPRNPINQLYTCVPLTLTNIWFMVSRAYQYCLMVSRTYRNSMTNVWRFLGLIITDLHMYRIWFLRLVLTYTCIVVFRAHHYWPLHVWWFIGLIITDLHMFDGFYGLSWLS